MIDFPAQFHGYKKTVLGDTIISFSVDAMFAGETLALAGKKIGTQFMLHLEDVTKEGDIANLDGEQQKDLEEKFRNKMHGLINEYAGIAGMPPRQVKDELKVDLRIKKLMVTSTKELDIKGLAIACNILERWIKEQS